MTALTSATAHLKPFEVNTERPRVRLIPMEGEVRPRGVGVALVLRHPVHASSLETVLLILARPRRVSKFPKEERTST